MLTAPEANEKPAVYYVRLYRRHGLEGRRVIKLGKGNDEAAINALNVWPDLPQFALVNVASHPVGTNEGSEM